MATRRRGPRPERQVTRYTYDDVKEPETGHTPLLPSEEQLVTLPMSNGWSETLEVGRLEEDGERPIVVDMDPLADPVLFWSGKRSKRQCQCYRCSAMRSFPIPVSGRS